MKIWSLKMILSHAAFLITLSKWGYEVVTCADGQAAWDVLKAPDAPRLLSWILNDQVFCS